MVHEVSRAHQDVERPPTRWRTRCVGCELVRRVQHRPAVTEGTRTFLAGRGPGRIDEKVAAAPLGGRVPCRKRWRRAAFSERLQRLARKEPLVRLLELGDGIELLRRRQDGGLRMTIDRSCWPDLADPGFGCRTSVLDREPVCSRYSGRRERTPPRSRRDHLQGRRPPAARAQSGSWHGRRSGSCR